MTSTIEQELVQASAFEPRRNYERQDYLAALARSINEIPEAEFDALSVEAQDWFNEAVRALNKKLLLPEFPDGVEGIDEDEPTDEADNGGNGAEVESAAAENGGDIPDDEDTPAEPDPKGKATKPKKPAKKVAKKAAKEEPKKPAKRAKGQPPVKLDHPPIADLTPETDFDNLELAFDEFGLVKGTKNHAAMAMLVKGCRMSDITETIGGTYYNVLRRLVTAGHVLEKETNGILRLTHKDLVDKPKAKKK